MSGDPEEILLCNLWNKLNDLEIANGKQPTTENQLAPVECIYANNTSSSGDLCDLWCRIQLHKDSMCIGCPEKFKNDIEATLLCDLWTDLEMIKHNIQVSGAITTVDNNKNTTCIYASHETSSDFLCEVWCEVQEYKGNRCVFCPSKYSTDIEELLCDLWVQLVEHENDPESTTLANPSNKECIHALNPNSAEKLCNLWCQVQSYTGSTCCDGPYIDDPEEDLLCKLWNELQELEDVNGMNPTTIIPSTPVDCVYTIIRQAVSLCVIFGARYKSIKAQNVSNVQKIYQ